MNVLIVHAHPEPGSFTTAMKDLAVETLTGAGHRVVVSDLYAMHFDPIASAGDFESRVNADYLVYALEQRNGDASKTLAPDIQAELDKLVAADLVIFSFPIFWFSTPAILKGWIDRVLVSGRCYGGMRFYDRGGLAGKKALVALTLGGQSHMFEPDGVHGPLEEMLKHLLRGTLGYVGFDVLQPFIGWHVPYVSQETRVALLEEYRDRLLNLESEPPMDFPTLGDFDELLRPVRRVAS
ncbi:NAD(P)H dehydrogenase [Variovorax sp. WS11]|uniref:NAD(P)H-dependent oxidoreductase n=1 Tax=Variovorax sp. WS11 TaxID=1105204 RepID=UPI000D0DBA36|nr:NAD(P)H-dependent oxidoreductase [Variovorax sp. WS11]NDZ17655.1 NAD(P)H-dependent oxidoreductase [Variovorax sp. WS11]PSL79565.1 NAD(P)H dehydrogenase [Variovorax sp. WS11]